MADDYRLLGENDPSPVRVLRPDGASPFFLTADHAGRAIPQRLGDLGLPESERLRHIAWDIGIAGVTERLSAALDATAVLQTYSRLVIDCNRDPEWDSSIPTISEFTRIPGNEAISEDERDGRLCEVFGDYHDAISDLLCGRASKRTVLVAMHSFTPVFKGVTRSVEVGILYNVAARDIRLPRIMLDLLRSEGDVIVGDNEPYSVTDTSDYTVMVHAERSGQRKPYVEIEIRQDLIADAAGQTAWAARFARLLPLAVERLRT